MITGDGNSSGSCFPPAAHPVILMPVRVLLEKEHFWYHEEFTGISGTIAKKIRG